MSEARKPPTRVALVLKGYPRLSETFIAQEILALERLGLAITIVSLRHPTDRHRHPVHQEIQAPLVYLPEYLWHEPLRVLRGWWQARRLPGYRRMRRLWLRDLIRDRSPNRVRRFGQACVLAGETAAADRAGQGALAGIGHVYAHFLHTPASVARYAACALERPWSVSAHARDIWTIPDWEKREKLAGMQAAGAAWAVTCTAYGAAHLQELSGGSPVDLVYHGLDFSRFQPNPEAASSRDGSDPADPLLILSVGRLVAKKGYDDLLRALAALPPDLHWRFVHVGGGAQAAQTATLAEELGLSDRIDWRGAQPQQAVLEALRQADLFVLASRIAEDGDRDGLPNVLMEAQSQRLACIATGISAIPELIRDGETGCLVAPHSPDGLAAAIGRLGRDPAERARLAAAGEARVRSAFAMERGIDDLAARFVIGAGPASGAPDPGH
ncbi:glycosyltransferase family 4 protein [Marinibaculum pumilum]|uniref:Glycosyltransferase family 4 protein n=1 Tax=Marinibaculum pumilum TaxID=1766165 RepID=A0ABV7KYP7_9PROT